MDRGRQSMETICLMLAYKVRYPENFFLLRGNHECSTINRMYGFFDECKEINNTPGSSKNWSIRSQKTGKIFWFFFGIFDFFAEICVFLGRRRYNQRVWKTFTDCFNCLPVAAVIDDKILCMHGGLSPELNQLDQINHIYRPIEVPETGKNHQCGSDNSVRSSLWSTLVGPRQRRSELGRKRQGSELHLRAWHCDDFPQKARFRPRLQGPSGGWRWLWVFC